jgi:hypothetical protein
VKPRPGQTDLFGGEVPPERADGRLTAVGFKARVEYGVVRYADPFRPTVLLTAQQARKLLADRQLVVGRAGFRVHYPEGRHTSARLGLRRATKEGAWHELRGFTGGHPHPGVWIVDDLGVQVWPPKDAHADG